MARLKELITNNLKVVIPGALVGVAVLAYLAFGIFGIHTLFIDDEVNEGGPVFASGAGASGMPSDEIDVELAAGMNSAADELDMPLEVTADDAMPDMVDDESTSDDAEGDDTEAAAAPNEIVTLFEGSFIDRSHPAVGVASVLNDGTEQRFLRFEDFETDNGPDLNVYLTRADADADSGDFGVDGDYIDLGDLKGNIGPQNYEIPPDVDLSDFDTVVIWCVRFGVAFGAADLAAT